jgi:hypothetical protein
VRYSPSRTSGDCDEGVHIGGLRVGFVAQQSLARLIRAPRRRRTVSNPHSPTETSYSVTYRSIYGSRRATISPIAIGLSTVVIDLLFIVWLLRSDHFPHLDRGPWITAAQLTVVSSIALMELLRLVQVVSLCLATITACDPLEPPPPRNLRVALLTTIVPNREPWPMVGRTLQAAKDIRCTNLDVWLLDEGASPAVRKSCARLTVKHFTRFGVPRYNTEGGAFAARTKHGNLNSWLDAHGSDYDVILCIDPDHVPTRDYAERTLGYFNDPDVAYVVGPQFYGNVGDLVSRAAESQQFPFHSIIQRAGNRYRAAMLVGTNNAIRVSALMAAGGFADSITEDMATGLVIKSMRNPGTGRRWESVYVPDVLAIGEGPSCWNDYFSQQLRWSRGGLQVIGRYFLPRVFKLKLRVFLHYLLIVSFYPSMALAWLLGAVNAVLFATVQAQGISVPIQVWTVLYLDATAFQFWVYIRSRRHNVSPFDVSRSGGLIGMAMTVMTAPMYAGALVNALLLRRGVFTVTPKGKAATGDSLRTFRRYFLWAGLYAVLLGFGILVRHQPPTTYGWPILAIAITMAPVVLWRGEQRGLRAAERARRDALAPSSGNITARPHPLHAGFGTGARTLALEGTDEAS